MDEDADKILDGKYVGDYSDFAYNGIYKVILYVKDAENNLVKTAPVNITVSGGQVVPTTTTTTSIITTTTTTVPDGTTTTTDATTTTTLPVSATEMVIDLTEGWNLLGVFLDLGDPDIEAVFYGLAGQIISSWKWADNGWAVCLPNYTQEQVTAYITSKGFNQMTELSCGEGFWVNSNAIQTLTCTGTPPGVTSHTLDSGWNLIGLKTNVGKSISEIIDGNTDKIASIWKWMNNTWAVYLPGGETEAYATSKGFVILEQLGPGEGFWINCVEAITLE